MFLSIAKSSPRSQFPSNHFARNVSITQMAARSERTHVQKASKVGIIGAGISGIAAAKQLSVYNPIVFEATDSIGGVWKSCSYSSTKLQTPRRDYEFSDYPWPERDESAFPSHLEVLDYLYGYAAHFDVLKFVQFSSKVVEIRYVGQGIEGVNQAYDINSVEDMEYGSLLNGRCVWEVAVQNVDQSESPQWYAFEFLVVCTGKYGDIPRKPSFPGKKGPEVFTGQVLHSIDYSKLDKEAAHQLLKGKKVAIVGYKKSAIDLALECAQANQGDDGEACTMVIRSLHWTVPSYSIWGLPFYLFYSTRFSQFFNQTPNQSLFKALFCFLFSPMRTAISKFIESYLVWKLPLEKYGLKPDHPFVEDYASCQMAILPENFFPEAEKGKIRFKRASKWWFWSGGLEFEDKSKLEADIVIFATGYDGKNKLRSILPDPFRALLEDSSGVMPLYRGTIHPLIPNMGFVGFIESVSNLHTAELRCKWLAKLAEHQFKLPTIDRMLQQIYREVGVMKKTTRFYKRHCISTFSINHSDEICEEMGWKPKRKSNLLLEILSPYSSQDYAQND